jgi:hypothetical protein
VAVLLVAPGCTNQDGGTSQPGKTGGQSGSGSGGKGGSGGSGSGGNASGGSGGNASGGSGGNASGGSGGNGSGGSGGNASGGSGGNASGGSGGNVSGGSGGNGSGGSGGGSGGSKTGGATGSGGSASGGSGGNGSGGSGGSASGGSGGNVSGGTGGSNPNSGTGSGGSTLRDGGRDGVSVTGGISGSGGASATGGNTGTGGSTSTSPCGVTPVSPNASPQARNLLCYLYSIYGKSVLSGQQETSWSNPAGDISWYTSNGMKYPAILGGDFLYHDGGSCTTATATTTRAIAYWNAGGLAMIRYHMGLPGAGLTCNDDCYNNGANCAEPSGGAPPSSFFTNVIAAGTPENTSLNAKLDYVAVQVAAMAAANVPVILAIYHETQSNGWFWWAMGDTGVQFVSLWTYTFNYLTKTKGLTNIIWLMPFSGSVSSAYLPGASYVDISGPDTYATDDPFSSTYSGAKSVIGATMPIPLHETGLIPTPSKMFPSTAPWLLFNVWAGYQSDGSHNTLANIQSVYADSHVITRDEIPNLK